MIAPTRRLPPRGLALCALAAVMSGCSRTVSTRSDDSRPMPITPRRIAPPPPGTQANAVAIQVAPRPRDTNGNGYPDLVEVAAYLFAEPHEMPLYEDGAFVFAVYIEGHSDDPGAMPLSEWRVEGDALQRARIGETIVGLAHSFTLSLLDTCGDTFPLMAVDLVCRFEPADGRAPIVRREVHKLQIGMGARPANAG